MEQVAVAEEAVGCDEPVRTCVRRGGGEAGTTWSRQLADGVLFTWVNGELAYEEGRVHTECNGRWLRASIDLQFSPSSGR